MCTPAGQPFDLTKTRLQTAQPGQYTGMFDVVKQTLARDGVKGSVPTRATDANPVQLALRPRARTALAINSRGSSEAPQSIECWGDTY